MLIDGSDSFNIKVDADNITRTDKNTATSFPGNSFLFEGISCLNIISTIELKLIVFKNLGTIQRLLAASAYSNDELTVDSYS